MNDANTRTAGKASGVQQRSDTAGMRPVSRPLLYAAVSNRLRTMIVELQLPPGERINEGDLARKLAISRTPVREALRILEAEGLVVLHPNRSSFISYITPEETAELFEALAGVERIGGELTAQRIGRGDLARFCRLHEEMFAFHSAGERAAYFELNDRIHRSFVELSGNARLVDFHFNLAVGATRIRYAVMHYGGRWDESVAEHKEILAAIEARDWRPAGDAIERHVLESGALACEVLQQLDNSQPRRQRKSRRAKRRP